MLANLHDVGIIIDCIMLCETFLSDLNENKFPPPGYQFVSNNRTWCKGGGVAVYTRESFQYKICGDLTMNINNELMHKLVIGEICRVRGTNAHMSLHRYQKILHMLSTISGGAMIGTDQHFNYVNLDHHGITGNLLDGFISCAFAPTINKPA